MSDKSKVGPFASGGFNQGKQNLNVYRIQNQEFDILTKNRIGWNSNVNDKMVTVKNAYAVTSQLNNNLIEVGQDIANGDDTEYKDTSSLLYRTLDLQLRHLKITLQDADTQGTPESVTLVNDDNGDQVIHKTIQTIEIILTSTVDDLVVTLLDLPIISHICCQQNACNGKMYLQMGSFFLPIITPESFTITDLSLSVKINGVLLNSSTDVVRLEETGIVPTTKDNLILCTLRDDVDYGRYSDNENGRDYNFIRNYKTRSYETELDTGNTVSLEYNCRYISPFVASNEIDADGDYNAASSGNIILLLDTLEVNSVAKTMVDKYLVYNQTNFALESHNFIFYTFPYSNTLGSLDAYTEERDDGGGSASYSNYLIGGGGGGNSISYFGFALQDSSGHIENTPLMPFVRDINNNKHYAFNLNDEFYLTEGNAGINISCENNKLTNIILKEVRVISEKRNQITFLATIYTYSESETLERKFLFDFKNTNAYTGGVYVSAIDCLWRLYVYEIRYQQLAIGNWRYWYRSNGSIYPQNNKILHMSLFSGNENSFGYLQETDIRFSCGHSITFVDFNLSDYMFGAMHEIISFGFKGFTIPIHYPGITEYIDTAGIFRNGNGSLTTASGSLVSLNSFRSYVTPWAMAHSFHVMPTIAIEEGNVMATLPNRIEDIVKTNPLNDGYKIGTNFINIANVNYIEHNNQLYGSSKYLLNPKHDQLILNEKGYFSSTGNFLLVTKQKSTTIYAYSREYKFNKITNVPFRTIADPILFNNTLLLPVEIISGSDKYLGVYAFSQEISSLIYTCTDSIVSNVVTHLITSGNPAISHLTRYDDAGNNDSKVITLIINNNLDITKNLALLNGFMDYLALAKLLSVNKAYYYKEVGTPTEYNMYEISNATSNYGILESNKFFPPSAENKIFIPHNLIVLFDTFTANAKWYLKYGINEDVAESYTEYTTANKHVIELSPTPVKYFNYNIRLGSDVYTANQKLKSIILSGHWVEGEY